MARAGCARASTVAATLPPDVDAQEVAFQVAARGRTLFIRRMELFPLRNVLPTGQTVWRISRSERGFARGGVNRADPLPRGASRQNRGKTPSGQMFPPKTQSEFARAAVNRSRAKISALSRREDSESPRGFARRRVHAVNRRNSTRAARGDIFILSSARALVAPRPRWFGLAGECDALKSRDAEPLSPSARMDEVEQLACASRAPGIVRRRAKFARRRRSGVARVGDVRRRTRTWLGHPGRV